MAVTSFADCELGFCGFLAFERGGVRSLSKGFGCSDSYNPSEAQKIRGTKVTTRSESMLPSQRKTDMLVRRGVPESHANPVQDI